MQSIDRQNPLRRSVDAAKLIDILCRSFRTNENNVINYQPALVADHFWKILRKSTCWNVLDILKLSLKLCF